jgi:hypothetical protein
MYQSIYKIYLKTEDIPGLFTLQEYRPSQTEHKLKVTLVLALSNQAMNLQQCTPLNWEVILGREQPSIGYG